MSDATLIPIGATLTVAQAVNTGLGFLYDPNQATFEIDSDGDWRLLHIKCTREENAPWVISLENAKLTDLQNIYNAGAPEYNPPRIVCSIDQAVPETTVGGNANVMPPLFETYAHTNPQLTYNYPFFVQVSGGGEEPFSLVTQMQYSVTIVQEVGTYIIPIAYHSTADGVADVRQVARSDLSFWPMPKHAVWGKFEKIIGLQATTVLPPP